MTVVVDVNDLRKEDVEFFRNQFGEHKGEQKLNFFIKNPADESQLEVMSMQTNIEVNGELIGVFNEMQKYQIFLN